MSASPVQLPWLSGTELRVPGLPPGAETIAALLDRAARRSPRGDAVVHVEREVRVTWEELRARSREFARALLALGVGRGDRVAIWARALPEWPVAQLGTATMGATLVTVNPAYRGEELAFVLGRSRSSVLLAAPRGDDDLERLRQGLAGGGASVRHVVVLPGSGGEPDPGWLRWGDLVARASEVTEAELRLVSAACSPGDIVNIQYTSGTTGFPKGASLTQLGLVANAAAVGGNLRLSRSDRLCLPVPLHHCFGCVLGVLAATAYGSAIVLPADAFDPDRVLRAVEQERCTAIYGVPTMFAALLERLSAAPAETSSLRTGIVAGAPVPPDLARRVRDGLRIPGLTIVYGLTEASPAVTQVPLDDPEERRFETVGVPLPGAEVRALDPLTGEPVPAGAPGEIVTRGPMVMAGYDGLPDETAVVVDADGWLHTGDLGVVDASGYWRVVGRAKDMIIRGGENVYPAQIEAVLGRHPAVLEAQVVGVPSDYYGEEAVAFVELRDGATATADELRDHCAAHLAAFEVPRSVELVSEWPLTSTGKVRKDALRERALVPAPPQPDHAAAVPIAAPIALPFLPLKGERQTPSPLPRKPVATAWRGWKPPRKPAWRWTSSPPVRRIETNEEQQLQRRTTVDRRRGERIKRWGIGGDVRDLVEATGEHPIMYHALGTEPQSEHPFNLYWDIRSQPETLDETFEHADEVVRVAEEMARRRFDTIVGIGSGTSQFCAQVGGSAFERFAGIPSVDVDSLDFLRHTPPYDLSRTCVMAYSGSGSTVDTVEAARRCRDAGAFTVAFTSVEGSPVVEASSARILTAGGFDTGGSDTFHYTARIAAATLLALELGERTQPGRVDVVGLRRELLDTGRRMREILDTVDRRCRTIAERFLGVRAVLVVGAGPNYGTAEEIALKFDEMCHIPAKAMNPGRHIHGALGLTDEQILTIIVAPPGPSYPDLVNIAKVTEMLKSPAVGIVSAGDREIADRMDYVVRLPAEDESIFPVLAILPGQLLPYYCGVGLGHNPDTQKANVPKHARVWNMLFPPGTH